MAPNAAKTSENIASALDTTTAPPFYKRKNGILLYFLLTSSLVSSMASGFDGVSWTRMTARSPTPRADNLINSFHSP